MYKIDEYLKSHEDLEHVSPNLKIYQLCFKGILMISSRETVIALGVYEFANGILVFTGSSVEHKHCPIKKDPVRATCYTGGWIIVPLQDSPPKSRVLYFNCVSKY